MLRTTTRRRKRLGAVVAVVAVAATAAVSVGLMAPAASADPSGDATGLQASLIQLLAPVVVIPPTPHVALPPGGSVNVLGVNAAPLASAGVLNVASNAVNGGAVSSASVAQANVLGALADAGVIEANCTSDSSGSNGTANVVGATVLGIPIVVATPPNTDLLGLATLNEQTHAANGITVKAVHVHAPLIGDLVVSEASCFGGTDASVLGANSARAGATAGTPNLTG